MKFNKWIAGLAAIVSLSYVSAAYADTDFFEGTRTYVAATTQNITVNGGTGLITNGPIDHVKFTGRVKIDFLTVTNTGTTGGTLTAQVFTSPDTTNLTALANYALITSTTTESVTNFWAYGNSNVVNNAVLLPGTPTAPTTVASSGYATSYLAPLQFTNSSTITLNGNKNVEIGFNADTQQRYIYIVYAAGGTVTNFSTGAILSGYTKF